MSCTLSHYIVIPDRRRTTGIGHAPKPLGNSAGHKTHWKTLQAETQGDKTQETHRTGSQNKNTFEHQNKNTLEGPYSKTQAPNTGKTPKEGHQGLTHATTTRVDTGHTQGGHACPPHTQEVPGLTKVVRPGRVPVQHRGPRTRD